MQEKRVRKIYTLISHMKEKTKEDYLIAIVQVEASNYTSYAFIKEDTE